ncbi:MAG: replicative DNA helicase [Elusimicrobiota bacterium]
MAQNITKDKLPPQNIEAERSVLGAMLIEENAVMVAMDLLEENYFYRTAHRNIFNGIRSLFQKNEAVDVVTVAEELKKTQDLESSGGHDYLTELVNNVVTASNAEFYAKIVRDKALLRELIRIASKIIEDSYSEKDDAQSLFDSAEQQVFSVREKNVKEGFRKIGNMVEEAIETIEKVCSHDVEVSGLSTGFKELDKMLAGLHRGNLIIVAGRPSMGKTSFGLNIAQYVGLEKKIPVGIFSLEMSAEEILRRMLCSEAQVNLRRVIEGYIGNYEWAALTSAADRLKTSRIHIDDSPSLTPLEMKARARRLKAQYPDLGLILVDYIQLMPGQSGGSESRQQEISYVSRNLKVLAKEINVPVIAMSQLSRAPEKRTGDFGSRPRLSDLRESGAIEQDADVVLFLYRPSYYQMHDEITSEEKNIAQIIVGKQRNGPTGEVKMLFQEEYTRFRDLTRKQEF